MTYLFLGEDSIAKDAAVAELKAKLLTSPEAFQFDYESLHANKLEPKTLKAALIALPAKAARRMIVIRECHRLSPQNRELLLEFLNEKPGHVDVILDSDELTASDSFAQKLKPLAKVMDSRNETKLNVFDLTKAISAKNPIEALKILTALLTKGEHPLQLMGGLVWFWGRSRDRVSAGQFKKGLLALQEADLNIKRSRLEPNQALELLVVKLCGKEVC